MCRQRRFLASWYLMGFTQSLPRELQLPGHLRPFAFETHHRFALLSVRPSSLRARLLRLLLTSHAAARAASPFQARGEISPDKNTVLRRTTAGFTPPEPWSSELRSLWPAHPARQRLESSSCTSAHGFDPRFLPTLGRPHAVAVHFVRDDLLTGGLAPPRQCPCWAYQTKMADSASAILFSRPQRRTVGLHLHMRSPSRP